MVKYEISRNCGAYGGVLRGKFGDAVNDELDTSQAHTETY